MCACDRDTVPLAESDLRNLPRERMSALIESLKAGSYDASEWDYRPLFYGDEPA